MWALQACQYPSPGCSRKEAIGVNWYWHSGPFFAKPIGYNSVVAIYFLSLAAEQRINCIRKPFSSKLIVCKSCWVCTSYRLVVLVACIEISRPLTLHAEQNSWAPLAYNLSGTSLIAVGPPREIQQVVTSQGLCGIGPGVPAGTTCSQSQVQTFQSTMTYSNSNTNSQTNTNGQENGFSVRSLQPIQTPKPSISGSTSVQEASMSTSTNWWYENWCAQTDAIWGLAYK